MKVFKSNAMLTLHSVMHIDENDLYIFYNAWPTFFRQNVKQPIGKKFLRA